MVKQQPNNYSSAASQKTRRECVQRYSERSMCRCKRCNGWFASYDPHAWLCGVCFLLTIDDSD